jgi:hypothetical protein
MKKYALVRGLSATRKLTWLRVIACSLTEGWLWGLRLSWRRKGSGGKGRGMDVVIDDMV